MEKYIFRKIREEELLDLFEMIKDRIKWMNEKNIKQWNVTNYLEAYPFSYYKEKYIKGEIYVLEDNIKETIVSAAVMLEYDERWNDVSPSYYIHNFVSKKEYPGSGKKLLKYIEEYAKENGKEYLRLDFDINNNFLKQFYENNNFVLKCKCNEGDYNGILCEKKI